VRPYPFPRPPSHPSCAPFSAKFPRYPRALLVTHRRPCALYAGRDWPASYRDADGRALECSGGERRQQRPLLVFTGRTGAGRGFLPSTAGSSSSPRMPRPGSDTTCRLGRAGAQQRLGTRRPLVRRRAARPRRRAAMCGCLDPKVEASIAAYRLQPPRRLPHMAGANSNTFTATVLRRCRKLAATLPPNALGKDFGRFPTSVGPTAAPA